MRTKKMYTNKSMRTGVILAAIAIITLIALIMTFAKYASQGTGEDSARVARWGVNSSIPTGLDLFDGRYTGPDGKTITVDSSDGANVVAPGTSKMQTIDLATFTGDQAPEVMYHFEPTLTIVDQSTTSSQTISMLDKLNANKAFTWKLVDTTGTVQSFQTYQELQNAVAAMGEPDIAPNHFPSNFGGTATPQIKIGWAWEYEYNGTTTNDPSDTEMGNLSANETLTGLNTTLTLNAYQCQGCTSTVALHGSVTQSDNTAVDGAAVTYSTATSNGTYTATTKNGGQYSMQVPTNSNGTFTVTKDGYNTHTSTISVADQPVEINVTNFDPKETTYKVTFACSPSDAGTVVDSGSNPVTEVSDLAKLSTISVDTTSNELVIKDYKTTAEMRYHTKDAEGYTFKEWQGIPDSGTITDNITVTAVFEKLSEQIEVTFTSSPTEGGTIIDKDKNPVTSKSFPKGSYVYRKDSEASLFVYDVQSGTEYFYYPSNNDNYIFSSWQIIDGKEISEEKIELTSDTSVAAIFKKAINKPTINSPLIYNGSLQQGVTYDDTVKTHCTIEGTTEATDANDEYSATFKIDDSVNFMWSDGDKSSTFTADWIIEKATNDWKTKPQPISEYSSVVSSSSVQSAMFDETTGNYKGTGMFGGDASYTVVSESYEGENALEQGINNLMNTGDSYNGNFSISEDGNNLVCAANTPVNKYTVKLKAEIPETNNYYDLSADLDVTWTVSEPKDVKQVTNISYTSQGYSTDKKLNFVPAYVDASTNYLSENGVKYYTDEYGTQEDATINSLIEKGCTMSELAAALKDDSGNVKTLWAEASGDVTFYGCANETWDAFFVRDTTSGAVAKYNESESSLFNTLLDDEAGIGSVYFDNKKDQTVQTADNWDAHDLGTPTGYDVTKSPKLNGVAFSGSGSTFFGVYGTKFLGQYGKEVWSSECGNSNTSWRWCVYKSGGQYWSWGGTSNDTVSVVLSLKL